MNKPLNENQRDKTADWPRDYFSLKAPNQCEQAVLGEKGVQRRLTLGHPAMSTEIVSLGLVPLMSLYHSSEKTAFRPTSISYFCLLPTPAGASLSLSAVQTQLFYLYALAWEYIYSGPMKQSGMKEHQFSLSNYPCACAALPANDR